MPTRLASTLSLMLATIIAAPALHAAERTPAPEGAAVYEAIATRGIGVLETFEAAARLAVRELRSGRHAAR